MMRSLLMKVAQLRRGFIESGFLQQLEGDIGGADAFRRIA